MKELRIVFMGTPEFAVEGLKTLIESGENVVGVITAPDRPAGRGRKINESAVKTYAKKQNLKIFQPTNLKSEEFLEELKSLNANLQIVVAFRMLPKVIWQMPEYGTFNLHASLLPDYRGAAPINWSIINGERKTGVTTFFIDEKIDTGAVILQQETDIGKNENAGDLHDKLMHLGGKLILDTVKLIQKGYIQPQPQAQTTALHPAPKLTRDNTKIDWKKPAREIIDKIRGLSPYPVAWTPFENNGRKSKMKIYAAHLVQKDEQIPTNLKEGSLTAHRGRLFVRCKNELIVLDEVQLPGKRKMMVRDLLNGFSLMGDAKVG